MHKKTPYNPIATARPQDTSILYPKPLPKARSRHKQWIENKVVISTPQQKLTDGTDELTRKKALESLAKKRFNNEYNYKKNDNLEAQYTTKHLSRTAIKTNFPKQAT